MRTSGILMHVTSLPGPYGIGTMGAEARRFLDFLEKAGQSYWQVLPLSPTGCGNSPYQAFSAFAGNHYLIDLDTLEEEGLLRKEELKGIHWGQDEGRVDFGALYENRGKVLYQAYERFIGMPNRAFQEFVKTNAWLPDYGLFMALKEEFSGTEWLSWPEGLRLRDPAEMQKYREKLKYRIVFQYFLQFKFFEQWGKLRAYAKDRGIGIIGDVPIYVPLDSADVWANPGFFQLDEERRPTMVAGVPPDAFTADGQLWGNPLYDWNRMKESGYAWWMRRLESASRMYDRIRLDHFRGFESYWAVPAGDSTAKNGRWMPGPGEDFLNAIHKNLPHLALIAEDLGYLTAEVRKLQQDSGYPGMKVLEFAFDSREPSEYLPHTYTRNTVCYTGTHDNQTVQQWFDEASPEAVEYAREYLALNDREGYAWGMIRSGMASVSDLFVAQMQDYLGLGAHSRMNFPGSLSGDNWTWRVQEGLFTEPLAEKIKHLTHMYGRDESRNK